MANNNSEKPGLHKPISSIFEGVPVPTRKVAPQTSAASAPQPPMRPTTPNPIADMPRDNQYSSAPTPTTPTDQTTQAPQTTQTTSPQTPTATVAPAAPMLTPKPAPSLQPAPEARIVNKTPRPGLFAGLKTKLLKPKPGVSPTRQKAMVVLVPVLAIALVFVLLKVLGDTPRKSRAKDKEINAAAISDETDVKWELPEPYPVGLRDPMTFAPEPEPVEPVEPVETIVIEPTEPNNSAATTNSVFEVKGVLISDNSCAIIGTRILYEGDTFEGATIVKITNGAVTFRQDGLTWTQTVTP